jgi:hypothetical protein
MMKNHTNNNRINSPSQNSGIKPIRHAPNAWSVTQMIDQAPRGMMIRELVKNGIEAAQRSATKGNPGRIVFDSFQDSNASGRVAKLRIFNTGPGMDAAELEKVMDLHSTSGGKANGAGQNFGLGAKLTGLVNNPAGMRYRSCKGGIVSEAILCKEGNDYGIRLQKDQGGVMSPVVDRTREAKKERRDVRFDWTEVVLFGEDAAHDTTAEPFGKGKRSASNWIADCVNNRFDELPNHVSIEIDSSLERGTRKQSRSLHGSRRTVKQSARHGSQQTVSLNGGVEVRFTILGKKGQNRYALGGHIALVHKGELYAMRMGKEWGRTASRFGITYGHSDVVVQICLPDAFAQPDQNRQRLQLDDPERTEVTLETWSEEIVKSLPGFVTQHVANSKPKDPGPTANLEKRLKDLLQNYDWRRAVQAPNAAGPNSGGPNNTRGNGKGGTRGNGGGATRTNSPGATRTSNSNSNKRGVLPGVDWVNGGTCRSSGEMPGLAANYDRLVHRVRLNLDYEGLDAAVARVVGGWPAAADQPSLQGEALQLCKEEWVIRVSKAVMQAYVHEGQAGWSSLDVDLALCEHALTVHVDDVPEIVQAVRTRLARGKWGKPTA